MILKAKVVALVNAFCIAGLLIYRTHIVEAQGVECRLNATKGELSAIANHLFQFQRPLVATAVTGPIVTKTLSQGWLETFSRDSPGCTGVVLDPYPWRPAGYGSNLNFLVLIWINAMLEGREDVAVVLNTAKYFNQTTCSVASNGVQIGGGWACIFAPVPHLCAFHTHEEWVIFNKQRGVAEIEEAAAMKRSKGRAPVQFIRSKHDAMEESIMASGLTMFEVVARLFDYLHSHVQPWFRADVKAILNEPDIAAVGEGEYVSMHIRRGDKLLREASKITTEVLLADLVRLCYQKYFKNAIGYLKSSPGGLTGSDITGLWISTDDEDVVAEVKMLAPAFFPHVKPASVKCITDRVKVRTVEADNLRSSEVAQDRNTYEAIVLLRAELEMMANAAVFSGTFSSNVGRVVALMRHTLGKPVESSVSADVHTWHFGL